MISEMLVWTGGGSRDFKTWRYIGLTNLPAGECASMYPLPPLTPGTGRGADGPLPTHVHKYGCGPADAGLHGDCYRLGSWTDSESSTGFWSATPGVPSEPQLVDIGSYCKIVMLSRFVALSVSLTQKVSLFQTRPRTSLMRSTAAGSTGAGCSRAACSPCRAWSRITAR